MTEVAVLNRSRSATTSGGLSAGSGRVTGNPTLSPAMESPRESWVRRAAQAVAGLIRNEALIPSADRVHRMGKGTIERRHLPKGGQIFCRTGRVWVTADGGGEDVVLSGGEFRWFRPGTWLLVEALAASEVTLES
ncbi:MAG TPA: DUF2917 domain-containing protein [Terrimicrobiaceae bacterium]|nr:DUF2917 domain-containing protein [Terrimicrobiaceae bacterium]